MDRAVGVGSCRGGYVYDHGLSLGVGLRAREAGGGADDRHHRSFVSDTAWCPALGIPL